MHLLFLDESGTPPKATVADPGRFVVGGLIIAESIWHIVRDGFQGLKVRHGVRGELKWRYFAPTNTDDRNPMRDLPPAQRNAIRADVYRLLGQHKSITSLACIVSCKAAYGMDSITDQADIYGLAYKGVSERFQYHLQDLSKLSGRKELGIIVSDHRGPKDDTALRAQHQKLIHSTGKFISTYTNIVETLFFAPSHLSVGVQLADMISGAVWRKYERNDAEWYDFVEPTMRKNTKGVVEGYGLIKMPKNGWV